MEKNRNGGFFVEELRKWILKLVSSLRSIPKRPDNPPPPRHPSESLE